MTKDFYKAFLLFLGLLAILVVFKLVDVSTGFFTHLAMNVYNTLLGLPK